MKSARKFRYADALAESLSTKNTNIILSIVEELGYRGGLDIAIDNSSEKCLIELLGFIYKKCDSTDHQQLVFQVLDLVLSKINKISPAGESEKVDSLLKDIREKLGVEVDTASQMNELDGLLEMIESKV